MLRRLDKVALQHVVIAGAGPAGLMAAHELVKAGTRVTILEKRPSLGGLGGTTVFEGRHGTYRFDFGGHRFITHSPDLLRLVDDLVGDDLLTATRRSVIRLGGRTYAYPLAPLDLLRNAPPKLLAGAAFDLTKRMMRPKNPAGADFASWTESRFGRTLYRTFFAGYTEKLWGIPPDRLSADWAEQRISLVDIRDVFRRLLPGAADNPRTYARSYRYPRHGFGVIFQRLAERLAKEGVSIRTGVSVTGFGIEHGHIARVLTDNGPIGCDAVISTLPLPEMVRMTGSKANLRFRGLRFLNFCMAVPDVSPWTWQYLSDPDIVGTRLQEPRRRSPDMAPPGMSSLMMEIPCDPGDELWSMPDDPLFARIRGDLVSLGIDPSRVTGEMFSARAATAYPLMTLGYGKERERALAHLGKIPNLVQCGRQGTFRYIFTDTAMEMGQMAAKTLLAGDDRRAAIYEHRNEKTVIEAESVA
jgi:protoporphyrinogen oxidase